MNNSGKNPSQLRNSVEKEPELLQVFLKKINIVPVFLSRD